MQNEITSVSSRASDVPPAAALVALCAGVLPVWGRHLAASRQQSETAVTQMLKAFADIGPHIDMAERQSQQINDVLVQADGGVSGLVQSCEQILNPLLQDANMSACSKLAIDNVLTMVRRSVGALEQIAKPFQHETQMVAGQVDRMYMGFQYQDRISQMMALLESDMARLQHALATHGGEVPDLPTWLSQLESQYAMAEQRENHQVGADDAPDAGNNETTFF